MRKFLIILPLVLLILNFLPVSLYKDKVNYGSSLDTLTPSHWKLRSTEISVSANLNEAAMNSTSSATGALSDGATFHGFPAGAYLSQNSDTKTPGVNSSLNATAWSWLWAGIDGLLVLTALFFAYKLNRKPALPKTNQSQYNSANG